VWRRLATTAVVLLVLLLAASCGQRTATAPAPAQPDEPLPPLPEAHGVFLLSGGEYRELRGSIHDEPPVIEAALPARLIVYPPAGWITTERQLTDFTGQQQPYKPTVQVKHFYKPLEDGLFEIIPADGFQPNRVYGLGIVVSDDTQWWYFKFSE
jgi:hypothetical protein